MSIPSGNNPYGGVSGDYAITWGMMEEGATHEEVMASIYSRMKDKIYTLRYPNRRDSGHQYPVAGLEIPHELAHGNDLRAALVSQDHIVPLADGSLPDRMHI